MSCWPQLLVQHVYKKNVVFFLLKGAEGCLLSLGLLGVVLTAVEPKRAAVAGVYGL